MDKDKLKMGETENNQFMRCPQTQCSFFIEGGCKKCDSCSSEEYVINKSCKKCRDCMSVPGEIRFGDSNISQNELDLQKEISELNQIMIAQSMQIEQTNKGKKVEVVVK